MAKRRQGATRTGAIGGAITPAMPSAPQPSAPISFNQFVAQPGAANANNPTASPAASNPFTAPTVTSPFQSSGLTTTTAPSTPTPTAPAATATNPNDHGTPQRQGPPSITLPNGTTVPNPVGPYDPALYADFARHWVAMQNAKVRGDDPANYGAGPQRTMAF